LRVSFKLIILALCAGYCYGFVGLRAGVGQFVAQDSLFKDTYANSYLFEVRFRLHEPLFIQGGTKLINIHNTSLPISANPDFSEPIQIGAYRHRLDAIGLYGGIGLGLELPEGGTGFFPYIADNGGVISPLVSQRVEYYMSGDTSSTMYKIQQDRHWTIFADISAGIEFRVIGIGVFVQGDYLIGRSIEYKSVSIDEIQVFPGGTIQISGWAIYAGITID